MTRPGDEVLTFAPYFPEYGPYVDNGIEAAEITTVLLKPLTYRP